MSKHDMAFKIYCAMLAAGNNTANIAQCYEAAEAFMQYAREAEPKKQKYKGEGVEDIPVRTK